VSILAITSSVDGNIVSCQALFWSYW